MVSWDDEREEGRPKLGAPLREYWLMYSLFVFLVILTLIFERLVP